MRNVFLSLVIVFGLQSIIFACTLGLEPLRGFDSKEFVFTGEVAGFVGSFGSSKLRQKAYGLKVKIIGTRSL
jgi:hypothetical protein